MDTTSSAAVGDCVEHSTNRTPLAAIEPWAKRTRCQLGETIYFQDDPADHWYRLDTGAARKCLLMADGRRQIVDFLFPGDLFGWGVRNAHNCAVEAIVADTVVTYYPRGRLKMITDSNSDERRRILNMAFEAIARLQMRMVLLGRTSALERVSAFLLEMADRCGGDCGNVIVLPMSRYDIADYLALAVETVSRALTKLRRCGAISLDTSRLVQIVDRAVLEHGAYPHEQQKMGFHPMMIANARPSTH